MRTVITDILENGGIDVVGHASDGEAAVQVVQEHDPDVVTMDYEMPGMNGVEAVEAIMDDTPTPILMLSAHTDGDASVTFEALEKGAVDFFTKPGGEVSVEMSRHEEQLVETVRTVANASLAGGCGRTADTGAASTGRYVENPTLVVASSTGGPTVVETVISSLPREADLRVIVVQHMPDGFTGRFADRLDAKSEYDVREAGDGDRIGGGEAVVAKGGVHLEVAHYAHGRIRLAHTDDPRVNGVKPAADVTMRSVADVVDDPVVGVVLTGMGRDGAAGIEAIKKAGGATIAQDEATSAVYGMPKQAVATGHVDYVRAADAVPSAVLNAITEDEVE